MRKIIVLILSFVIVFGLVGCNNGGKGDNLIEKIEVEKNNYIIKKTLSKQ